MRLYDYFRSSASYRVRIALNLKNIAYERSEVHLLKDGGEQHTARYQQCNPQKLVPCLETDAVHLSQSIAIIEYLEERYPEPALLPRSRMQRALARSMAQLISCDVHPLNNLRVLNYLKHHFHADETAIADWYRHWIEEGFSALERQLKQHQSQPEFCVGEQVSIADVCLVPQVYNARRFKVDMQAFPRIEQIDAACRGLPAFMQAAP
ncbi:MAG: maleylacetoacetate isomerase [Legionellaceae bacterium]|nr:maleylacetoacetate isomerase [Legionellaceae bacterium]